MRKKGLYEKKIPQDDYERCPLTSEGEKEKEKLLWGGVRKRPATILEENESCEKNSEVEPLTGGKGGESGNLFFLHGYTEGTNVRSNIEIESTHKRGSGRWTP